MPRGASLRSILQKRSDIIDDFEDGDISEYGDLPNDDLGSFRPDETMIVKNGKYSLQCSTGGGAKQIHSITGLDYYPESESKFRFNSYADSTELILGIRFAVKDEDNFYYLRYRTDTNEFQFYIRENGNYSLLAEDTTVTIPVGEWFEIEVDWESAGTIVMTLFNASGTQLSQISVTDNTFTSGGIGWAINTTAGTTQYGYVDYARVV